MKCRDLLASLALLVGLPLIGPQVAAAQFQQALEPARPTGQAIAPYFEGWYTNDDGTYTFSFGYFNFNTEEVVEIPVGADNFIMPSEYDGVQPTLFGVTPRRERGTHAVTVPGVFGESGQRVVWTLIRGADTLSVPARIGVQSLELTHGPMAMGSAEPLLRLEEDGPEARGPQGVVAAEVERVAVGEPLTLTAWVTDPSDRRPRYSGAPQTDELEVPISLRWFTHQGPGEATFERVDQPDAVETEAGDQPDADEADEPDPNFVELPIGGGAGTILARFSEPGEYVLRVRADSFDWASDSGASDQCCWTNGYVRVEVSP